MSGKQERSKTGKCLLTGTVGKFSKSHIIPKSLTQPEYPGGMLFQHGPGRRAQKRRTSWYDSQIVTAEGEAILADLDDCGIKVLRQHRLVWSGFGPVKRVPCDHTLADVKGWEDYGVREIKLNQPDKLRKFLLSILWRAAVSTLPEMNDVRLNKMQIDELAAYIVGIADLPLSFFPCFLTQYPEVGFIHNQTPTRDTKTPFPGLDGRDVEIFRFYFDGLVLHFHNVDEVGSAQFLNNELTVGSSERLYVTCVPWGRSKQLEKVRCIASESLW